MTQTCSVVLGGVYQKKLKITGEQKGGIIEAVVGKSKIGIWYHTISDNYKYTNKNNLSDKSLRGVHVKMVKEKNSKWLS